MTHLENRAIGPANEVQLVYDEQRHVPDLLPGGLPPAPAEHVPMVRGGDDHIGLPQHGVVSQGVASQQAHLEAQPRGAKLVGPVCKALLGELLLGGNVDCPGASLACCGLQTECWV